MKKFLLFIFILFFLHGCVGTASKGVFGTGVSIAFDPRTVGTQIDDSIMQKNLVARLTLTDKKYLLTIGIKVIDGRFFLTGKVDNPEEKLQITKMAWETKGTRSVRNDIKIKEKFNFKTSAKADEILKNAQVFKNLEDAINDLQFVFATSNRKRDFKVWGVVIASIKKYL